MAYRFNGDRSLRHSVRRIARELLVECRGELPLARQRPTDEAIHRLRRKLRKLRALLRLIRPVISDDAYCNENRCFQFAGRRLASVRDAAVRQQMLHDLIGSVELPASERLELDALLQSWDNQKNAGYESLIGEAAFVEIDQLLVASQARVREWSSVPDRWRTIGRGLKATFTRARSRRSAVAESPTIPAIHNWRKEMRCLHLQLQLIQFLDPAIVKRLAAKADQINKQLGAARDFSLLQSAIFDAGELSPSLRERLDLAIRAEVARSLQTACELGDRFLAPTPARFCRDLKSLWTARRQQPS